MKIKDIKKKNRYYFICSLITGIVFLAIGAYTIYAAIPSPGHGTSALEGNASLNMNSNKVINLATPTAATDAATKAYVDASGGTVAFRHVASGPCPTVAGTTCRAMLYFEGTANHTMLCTWNWAGSYGGLCLYSSL